MRRHRLVLPLDGRGLNFVDHGSPLLAVDVFILCASAVLFIEYHLAEPYPLDVALRDDDLLAFEGVVDEECIDLFGVKLEELG